VYNINKVQRKSGEATHDWLTSFQSRLDLVSFCVSTQVATQKRDSPLPALKINAAQSGPLSVIAGGKCPTSQIRRFPFQDNFNSTVLLILIPYPDG